LITFVAPKKISYKGENKKMKKLKVYFLTTIVFFISSYSFSTNPFGDPLPISFAVPLQAGSATFDMAGAKSIANALFYIAITIGAITIIRTMVFNPDRAKKVIINWCVGIIVFAVVINVFG
jgi:hypothetical protein